MEEEIIEVDISHCIGFMKYLYNMPIELELIKKFKMSFQIGKSNSEYLNTAISKFILKKEEASLIDILNAVGENRYYKCINKINTIIERAILMHLKVPDILGVEYVSIREDNKKLLCKFKVLR